MDDIFKTLLLLQKTFDSLIFLLLILVYGCLVLLHGLHSLLVLLVTLVIDVGIRSILLLQLVMLALQLKVLLVESVIPRLQLVK